LFHTEERVYNMSRLLNRIQQEIRRRNYSYRTEKSYIHWIKRFIKFSDFKHPLEIERNQVASFLNYLAIDCNVAASTQNQALCAIVFLYKEVLNHPLGELENLKYAKRYKHVPVVLSELEVRAILDQMNGVKKLIVSLIYGSGLRISECLRLRIQDIDFDFRQIEVRDGKGRNDRITMLPESLVLQLQQHIKKVKWVHNKDLKRGNGEVLLPKALSKKYPNASRELKWQYLFPSKKIGKDPQTGFRHRYHQSPQSVNREIKKAVRKTGIQKKISAHTFRHSFATHLLKNGYDIRTVQELLGHKSVKTTMIYTHVLNRGGKGVVSPLDQSP